MMMTAANKTKSDEVYNSCINFPGGIGLIIKNNSKAPGMEMTNEMPRNDNNVMNFISPLFLSLLFAFLAWSADLFSNFLLIDWPC